jgi:hypothetical protein
MYMAITDPVMVYTAAAIRGTVGMKRWVGLGLGAISDNLINIGRALAQ